MISLALAHLKYNRMLSAILTLCMTTAIFLPLVTWLATDMIDKQLSARSDRTPLLIGAKGSPFLLTLNSIYFRTEVQDPIPFKELRRYRDRCKGEVIPLYTGHTAMKHPVVGTSFRYFSFRGLSLSEGRYPTTLGEAVAGAGAAETLGLDAGGYVITDCENIYDISAEYPLKLRITGILEPTGTADDNVIFADFRTVWIMDGIGHGHEDAVTAPESVHDESIQFIEASEVKYNSRLKKYTEITPENIDTFHFHGDDSAFPLTAMIVIPDSHKEMTLVLSETRLGPTPEEAAAGAVPLQAVKPSQKIAEILELLLDFKRVLDGFSGLVLLSTAAFLGLVLSLLFRLRRDEMEILYKIGGSKHAMKMLLAIETAILLALSAVLAGAFSLAAISGARTFLFS